MTESKEIEALRRQRLDTIEDILDEIAAERDFHRKHMHEQGEICRRYLERGEIRDAAEACGNANAHQIAAASYTRLLTSLQEKHK